MPRTRGQITGSGFIVRSPRILLDELDNHAGAYSTAQRTGDTSRLGTLATNFDDSTTIIFSDTGNPVFPSMLPRGSTFNSQAVDVVGEESDISITAPIRSFQHPTYLHYSPEEQMGPFNENRVMPATEFFLSGTDPDIMPGFTSPLRSKIAITFDITPQTETLLTRNVKSRAEAEQGTRAIGTLTISAGHVPVVGDIVTIVSRDGYTKDYIFKSGSNGTLDGTTGKVIVNSTGFIDAVIVAQRYREAIQSFNGHASRITCVNASTNIVTMTQTVGGTAGNTTIGISFASATHYLAASNFTGGLNNGSSIENQSGFMYYNFVRKEWEQIGLNDPAPGNALLGFDYAFNSSAASVTFPAQFSISPSFSNETVDARVNEGYDKIGSPTEIMGAPGDTKYHATSSQLLRLSNYINSPMLLEGISVNFKNVWARRVQGDCLSSNQADRNGAARDIDNYTFFAYRQDRSLSNDFVRDSISNISGSTRSLIFSGSMSFWNSGSFFNDNTAGARLLHSPAFDYNFGLLYTNNFLVGQYKGPISMQLKPAVSGRQMLGLGRYFNIGSQTSVLSRNFWPGGTSPKKSQKLWTIAGSPSVIDAYGWTSNPDSAMFSQRDDSRAFRVHGGEAAPANLASSEQGLLVSSRVEQSAVSPYLLLPTDELVFGLEAGLSQLAGSLMFSSITGSHIRIFPEDCQVTFYGSLIQDNKEHTLSLNQNLSSNAVHEIIGAEPVLDQFQIEPISSYCGSYLDNIITGSMATPSANTTLFTTASQDDSRRIISRVSLGQAGTTGSLQRFVKMIDQTERTYDSCLPDIFTFVSQSDIGLTGSLIFIGQGVFDDSVNEYLKFLPNQFPFFGNPKRTIETDKATYLNSNSTEGSDFIEAYSFMSGGLARMKDLVFRTGWKIKKRALSYPTPMAHRFKNTAESAASQRPFSSGTFRYGISNIDPEFSSVRWNASSFGQPRDMLEPRLGVTTSDGTPPVKIHFVSGSTYNADPNNTHTQNISSFATSSIPWIDDGLFRNREDNPDETLLIV